MFDAVNWNNVILLIILILMITVAVLSLLLTKKTKDFNTANTSLKQLIRSFGELDEQAKLIVRTDLELNKAQEELDKRLNGIEALQKTSQLISTTLDQNEIFRRLDQPLFNDLGFEKGLLLIYSEQQKLNPRIKVGFTAEQIQQVILHVEKDQNLIDALKEGQSFSSATTIHPKPVKINYNFGLDHFILTPVLTQNGMIGLLLVGNPADATTVTAGDEELISILANQVGQSLENAQLFEQVYRSSQILESKVQERTRQLASVLEEVKKISKTKSEFISAVSHELRTPLTSIKGYASLLMTGKIGDIPVEVKERLEKINKHSDNLVKFINDLLDIARIESGRAEMKFDKYSVAGIIESTRDLLVLQMREKNINWTLHIDPKISEIFVDRSQIERVFINVIGNAIKFTPESGTISVKVKPGDKMALIEISDTGIGISEEDIPKLFSEFYRVDNEINQNVKGTGLGLVLVKNIIEAHQGKIWVTSQPKKGTTFHFTLPMGKLEKIEPITL